MTGDTYLTTDVKHCARCKEDHYGLTFELTNVWPEFSYETECPTTGDKVYLQVVQQ